MAGLGGSVISNNNFLISGYVANYGSVVLDGTFTDASTCEIEVKGKTLIATPTP